MGKIRKIIEIYGIVQGVGFRPFVYNLASKNNLTGHVNNNSNGVFIDIQGEKDNINEFIRFPPVRLIIISSRLYFSSISLNSSIFPSVILSSYSFIFEKFDE